MRGLLVICHDDVFPPHTPDAVWLTAAGQNGWIVLTKDTRIRYRPNEKGAIIRSGTRAFVLRGGEMTGDQMAEAFLKSLRKMERLIKKQAAPFIAGVSASGKITLLLPKPGKRR